MPYVKIGSEKNEDVMLSYADYGEGKPVVLIHGWPLSHRMWEQQILALTEAGYRVIAYDRRGFGESYKPWGGYDYDTFTADLHALIEKLDLRDVTLVGFSMGGGEVARYISTYGTDRVSKAVLMSAVTPFIKKTDDNPEGVDASVFEGMLSAMKEDRPKFLEDFNKQFVNWGLAKHDISQAMLNHSWDIAVWASPKATIASAEAFSGTDFREDLKALVNVPTLIIHGDDDKIVPYEASGLRSHDLLPNSQIAIVEGGAHGLPMTQPEEINKLLLDFLKS